VPCDDQTEILELVLDTQDLVKQFRLYKMSCGKPVGDDSLLAYIQDTHIEEILMSDISDVVPDIRQKEDLESFLLAKQLFSIRAALGVWTGSSAGMLHEPFALDELFYEEEGVKITGLISVDLIREEIKACASCTSCKVGRSEKAQRRIDEKKVQAQSQQQLLQDVLSALIVEHEGAG